MTYRPLDNETIDRFLRYYTEDDTFTIDGYDGVDLLQQAKRANALAEAVRQYELRRYNLEPMDVAKDRMAQALSAYLGRGEE